MRSEWEHDWVGGLDENQVLEGEAGAWEGNSVHPKDFKELGVEIIKMCAYSTYYGFIYNVGIQPWQTYVQRQGIMNYYTEKLLAYKAKESVLWDCEYKRDLSCTNVHLTVQPYTELHSSESIEVSFWLHYKLSCSCFFGTRESPWCFGNSWMNFLFGFLAQFRMLMLNSWDAHAWILPLSLRTRFLAQFWSAVSFGHLLFSADVIPHLKQLILAFLKAVFLHSLKRIATRRYSHPSTSYFVYII